MKEKPVFFARALQVLSLFYCLLLFYNLFAGKLLPAAISLLLFLSGSPWVFRTWKAAHATADRALQIATAVATGILAVLAAVTMITGSLDGTKDAIPAGEQQYIDTVLSQITADTTKEEAVALLGTPDRDLVYKVNWWVTIEGRKSRVGLYFSPETGRATELVLDGGIGRFYYRQPIESP